MVCTQIKFSWFVHELEKVLGNPYRIFMVCTQIRFSWFVHELEKVLGNPY